MPRWLKTVLLVVGLLILVAFLTEPVLVVRRRRQRATAQEAKPSDTTAPATTAPETTNLGTTVPQGAVPALQLGKALRPRGGLLAARRVQGAYRPRRLRPGCGDQEQA